MLLNRDDVLARTTLGHDLLYRLIRSGAFPSPIKLSERRVAWDSAEVDAWIEERKAERETA